MFPGAPKGFAATPQGVALPPGINPDATQKPRMLSTRASGKQTNRSWEDSGVPGMKIVDLVLQSVPVREHAAVSARRDAMRPLR